MPAPLNQRVLDAVAAAVGVLTPEVPAERRFVRAVTELIPERDRLPAVVVSETPGAGVERTKRMARTDTAYPVTVIMADAQNRKGPPGVGTTADPDWRTGWRERLLTGSGKLVDRPLPGVAESLRVMLDTAVLLDLSQFEAANLWYSVVTLRVLCRERDA